MKKYSIISFFYGHFAVNFFIVLSGFCLTIPLIKHNTLSLNGGIILFYKKRFKRIAIPYYLAVAFSLLLILSLIGKNTGRHWDVSLPVTGKSIVTHLLLVQDVFSETMFKINHALWTISVEFRIYLFFPLLLWVWRKFGIAATLLLTVVISVIIFLIATYANTHYNLGIEQSLDGVNPYIVLFALGMLAAHISLSSNHKAARLRAGLPWLIICIALFVLVFAIQRFPAFANLPYSFEYHDVLFGCWTLSFLVLVSGDKVPFLKRILSFRPLVFAGTFAFSIYLIHAPLIQVIWQYIIAPMGLGEVTSYYLMVFIGTPFIVAVSYLFYLFCERPFMNHKKPAFSTNQDNYNPLTDDALNRP
ncbi:acyltransferase family protein [Mucilaginibacter pedocola]|uniref:Acyltransferase 3 domain-containing protein n=1 Tax=Mucilaginibacter pedocola TaxID=1792845 RepID=A0A1S9P7W6_9SPHI|nr:acyltransferase [Mucilaginibacter pedocola]OOQ57034.1 hypothetical protein BC343_15985 [Mucilaginibacter pedocola]